MSDSRYVPRVEPDPGFADRLERDLLDQLAGTSNTIALASNDHDSVTLTRDLATIDLGSTLPARSRDGTIIDTEAASMPPDSRHRWLIVAAATVVAVVGGVLVYLIADDGTKEREVPAGPPSTVNSATTQAVQIARAFVETRWSDPDQALRYVSDDVTCSRASRCLPNTARPALPTPAETGRTAENLRLEGAMFEALGDRIVNVRCEQQDASAAGITVRCAYDYHTFRSEELGHGPFTLAGPVYDDVFVIRDRMIVSISPPLRDVPGGAYFRQTWDEFRLWMSIQHPDDIALMYESDAAVDPLDGIPSWRLNEQSIALWQQYTLEYAADRTQQGFNGLPPEGAAPSTPEHGELVVHSEAARWWLYADGRLISQRNLGYLVQRLTPEGVELLRDEVLSSGQFEQDLAVDVGDGIRCPGEIQVRNGDRLVSFSCGGSQEATPEQIGWLLWLNQRLAEPAQWLPPSAWEDHAHTQYVASRFRVCVSETAVLPEAAAAVLAEGTPTTGADMSPYDSNARCTDLSTEQARTLAAALAAAGARQDPNLPDLIYWLVDAPGQDAGSVWIATYLPHGEAPGLRVH